MSTSPTAQVLAQWEAWAEHCTDRLFELDARVTAEGTDGDRLDVAAVFVARKAIVERIDAMRAGSLTDESAAATLAARPLVDEHGELVANDLSAAATLADAIMGRIERHLAELERVEAERIRTVASLDRDLLEAERLSADLGAMEGRVAELRDRRDGAARDAVALAALAPDVAAVAAQLRARDAERIRVLDAVPTLPGRIAELHDREAEVRALVQRVREKVTPVPNLAVPAVATVGPVPEHDGLPWPAARALLQPYVLRVERVAAALDEVEARFGAALERRDELRGLLQAFRAKAGARRLAEDARLDPQYRAAADVLWSAPCDLDRAATLVAAYTDAVNAAIDAIDARDEVRGVARTREERR